MLSRGIKKVQAERYGYIPFDGKRENHVQLTAIMIKEGDRRLNWYDLTLNEVALIEVSFAKARLCAEAITHTLGLDGADDGHSLLRWLAHGEREALVAGMYLLRWGLPVGETTDATLQDVMLGFLLHDIGKVVSVNAAVWDKQPFELTPADLEGMRKHVSAGRALLQQYEEASGEQLSLVVYDILLYHHEKLDGSSPNLHATEQDIPFFGKLAAAIDQILSREENHSYHSNTLPYTLETAFVDVYRDSSLRENRRHLYDHAVLNRLGKQFANDVHMQLPRLHSLGSWRK